MDCMDFTHVSRFVGILCFFVFTILEISGGFHDVLNFLDHLNFLRWLDFMDFLDFWIFGIIKTE